MPTIKEKGKYFPLYQFLSMQQEKEIVISYEEIEKIICSKLPQSAYRHQAWWGNTRSGTYIQSAAWLEAGYRVMDIQFGKSVEFHKVADILLTKKRKASRRV